MQRLAEERVFEEVTAWFKVLPFHHRLGLICDATWPRRMQHGRPLAVVLTHDYMMNDFKPEEIEGIEKTSIMRFIFSCINISLDEAMIVIRRMFASRDAMFTYCLIHGDRSRIVVFNKITSVDDIRDALDLFSQHFLVTFVNAPMSEIEKQRPVPLDRVEEALGRDREATALLSAMARRDVNSVEYDPSVGTMYPRGDFIGKNDEGEPMEIIERSIFLRDLHPYLIAVEKKFLFNGLKIRHAMGKCLVYDVTYATARRNALKKLEQVV